MLSIGEVFLRGGEIVGWSALVVLDDFEGRVRLANGMRGFRERANTQHRAHKFGVTLTEGTRRSKIIHECGALEPSCSGCCDLLWIKGLLIRGWTL